MKKPRQRRNQKKATQAQPQILLFDLSNDVGEQVNLAAKHPDVVNRLQQRMQELDNEITLNARAPWIKNKN